MIDCDCGRLHLLWAQGAKRPCRRAPYGVNSQYWLCALCIHHFLLFCLPTSHRHSTPYRAAVAIVLGERQNLSFPFCPPGVTLTLSSMIDAKNFNQGGHKLGLCLELEA